MHETEFIQHFAEFLTKGPFSDVVFRCRNYLEFGIKNAVQFNLVAPLFEKSVAVDKDDCSDKIRINDYIGFWMTTREFISDVLPKLNMEFGLVYIDADHSHEETLLDFVGVLPYVSLGGYIMLHDSYPPSLGDTDPGICGEVWKTVMVIKEAFPYLELVTVTPGYGVTIVRKP